MEYEEVKGLVIFSALLMFSAFILGGIIERRLVKLARVLEDDKYVN